MAPHYSLITKPKSMKSTSWQHDRTVMIKIRFKFYIFFHILCYPSDGSRSLLHFSFVFHAFIQFSSILIILHRTVHDLYFFWEVLFFVTKFLEVLSSFILLPFFFSRRVLSSDFIKFHHFSSDFHQIS